MRNTLLLLFLFMTPLKYSYSFIPFDPPKLESWTERRCYKILFGAGKDCYDVRHNNKFNGNYHPKVWYTDTGDVDFFKNNIDNSINFMSPSLKTELILKSLSKSIKEKVRIKILEKMCENSPEKFNLIANEQEKKYCQN